MKADGEECLRAQCFKFLNNKAMKVVAEAAQGVKGLWKHEDLRLDPQHPRKKHSGAFL